MAPRLSELVERFKRVHDEKERFYAHRRTSPLGKLHDGDERQVLHHLAILTLLVGYAEAKEYVEGLGMDMPSEDIIVDHLYRNPFYLHRRLGMRSDFQELKSALRDLSDEQKINAIKDMLKDGQSNFIVYYFGGDYQRIFELFGVNPRFLHGVYRQGDGTFDNAHYGGKRRSMRRRRRQSSRRRRH